MNKKLLIRIGIGVIIVVLAGFAIWRIRTPIGQPQASASVTPGLITYGTAPADWQTYASQPFKLAYPSDWRSGPCGTDCIAFGPAASGSQALIGINITATKLSDILVQAAPYQLSKDEITIGTLTWTKVVLKHPQTGDIFVSHFIEHGGKVYELGLATQDQAILTIYGQMISSFAFTK
jgi:hypothetical protein